VTGASGGARKQDQCARPTWRRTGKGAEDTFTIGDLSRLDHGLDEKAIVHRPIEEAARIT
jgi:hypothetical protein